MTLHWWMHWFWVTVQFLIILGNPLPSTTVEPQAQPQGQLFTGASTFVATAASTTDTEESSSSAAELSRQSGSRVAKAIEVYPQSNTASVFERQTTTEAVNSVESLTEDALNATSRANNSRVGNTDPATNWTAILQRAADNVERYRNAGLKKDSKIAWILSTSKTNRSMYEGKTEQRETENTMMQVNENRNASIANEKENLSVLPLQEEDSRFRLVLNKTGSASSLLTSSSGSSGSSNSAVTAKTFNRSDDKVEIDGLAEHQIFATAASILEAGASEPTRLSRARSAFSSGFQKDQTQADHRSPDYNDVNNGKEVERINEESTSSRSVDIAAITGSCMATVVLLSTMGSVGFIMYRRRYLNPPQTLNSDKCSNPDSSGYIDDSTIRDNSEEMYSLDNDSFLNSLEAMTIQNYWTDSVKHTKL